jgi:hypothetical protein
MNQVPNHKLLEESMKEFDRLKRSIENIEKLSKDFDN